MVFCSAIVVWPSAQLSTTSMRANEKLTFVIVKIVSEPDPRKIEKEGLAHRPGWKCTLRPV